ncbi:MAG: exopolygalacturonase, partial [Leadbetterella sp.]|nr:exopolygalacturonase [Leadbetterella sp.]
FARDIKLKNVNLEAKTVFDIQKSEQYVLSGFTFENLVIKEEKKSEISEDLIQKLSIKNVTINDKILN